MKKEIVLCLLLCLSMSAIAQKKPTMKQPHSIMGLDCKRCHSCALPTKANPCLTNCPREEIVSVQRKPEESPRIIRMQNLQGPDALYAPVTFSHRLHAEMSEMSGGCSMCHHFNPPGTNVLPCKECHDLSRKRADISKPDYKGAAHRQCMDCHKSWSHETECVSCHAPKTKDSKAVVPSMNMMKSSPHPKLVEPTKKIYSTPGTQGKIVTFYHNEHNEKFGLECTICHADQGCGRCHDKHKSEISKMKSTSTEDKHSVCSKCHSVKSNCKNCHKDKEAEPFAHERRTGWPLSRFHSKLACTKCHSKAGIFSGLSNECKSCHGTWTLGTFDHKVTGLKMDDLHAGFECSDCHLENSYQKKDCKKCHDDKTYPKSKPGTLIGAKAKQNAN
jgi:hypothetical protein